MKYTVKLGSTCLGMLAIIFLPWLLFVTFKMCTATRVEKEIHLIPKDYRGDIFILFNRQDGMPSKYSNRQERIYEIPKTGILETTLSPNKGGFSKKDRRFYYVDENKNHLKEFSWITNFGLHHKSYNKGENTIKEDSLLVFNLANNQNIIFDSIPNIKHIDFQNQEFLFYTIDSFKHRPIVYK